MSELVTITDQAAVTESPEFAGDIQMHFVAWILLYRALKTHNLIKNPINNTHTGVA